MSSINKVILIGNAGRDPEIRRTNSGEPIANLSIATTESFKDKNSGEKKETVEWHRLVFFGRLAEIAEDYIKKGSKIYVEGKIKSKKWSGDDGIERTSTEIFVSTMKLLSSMQQQELPLKTKSSDLQEEDIPF